MRQLNVLIYLLLYSSHIDLDIVVFFLYLACPLFFELEIHNYCHVKVKCVYPYLKFSINIYQHFNYSIVYNNVDQISYPFHNYIKLSKFH